MIGFITIIFIIMLLMLIKTPIYVSFLASSVIAVIFFIDVPFSTVVQNMYSSLDKFALMAVPFFIFAAEMMSKGGMARRLINWVSMLVGGVKGGLGVTTVVSASLFGAMSGSSPATVAALGKILYPHLQKGYGEKFSAGLITSVGAISMIIPPSIGMILYGISANVSVGTLFIAGILPGIVLGLSYIAYVVYYVTRHDVVEYREVSASSLWTLTKEAVWSLGVPVIVIGGIYSGVFTPTESAAIAAVYAVIISRFVYRDVNGEEILRIAISSSLLTAKIFILVAASSFLSYYLTINYIPQTLTNWVGDFTLSPIVLLLIINVILLIAGMFIEPNSAILIFTPLFLPMVVAMGVDPVHFGIILTVNLAIGMYTPPFGLNIFVSSASLKLPISKIVPGLTPFIVVSILALILISVYPDLSLYLVTLIN